MKALFDTRQAARVAGVTRRQIRYWNRTGLVPASERKGGRLLYDFKALTALRTIGGLLGRGFPTRRIRAHVDRLRRILPEIDNPLSELRILDQGGRIAVRRQSAQFTTDGQLQIRFEDLPVSGAALEVLAAEEIFFRALAHEESGDFSRALAQYTTLLKAVPDHADALVNTGNIEHYRGSAETAERCYRSALEADPAHPEANYNLANLVEERGDLKQAVDLYRRAVLSEPGFADAHFNLARTLDRAGRRAAAKKHWRRYLELRPGSKWSKVIKARIAHPD